METRQRRKLRMIEVDGKEELPSKHEVNPTVAGSLDQDGRKNLVFDVVIRTLKSPKLLRTCRLVCKAWNEFACSQLKSVATTKVVMDDDGYYKTKTFASLRQLMDGSKSGETLPSPFRKVSLKTMCMDETKFFNAFTKYLGSDLILTELELHGERFSIHNTKNLMSILRSQATSLQVLTVGLSGTEGVCRKTEEELQEMQFPSLKRMKWSGTVGLNFFGKAFIRTIVLHSKLELLRIQFHRLNELEELFRSTSFDNVAILELGSFVWSPPVKSADVIQVFAVKPWRNLIRLNISVEAEQDVTEIVSWLKDSLELVHISKVRIPLDDLPKCPKLREIRSSKGYNGQLLPEKFPALKKFYNRGRPSGSNLATIIPHYGVIQAKVRLDGNFGRWQHEDGPICQFCDRWESWELEFPTLKVMKLIYFREHEVDFCEVATTLQKINHTFPNLKKLSIAGDEASGLTSIMVPKSIFYKSYRKDIRKLPLDFFTNEIFPFEDFLELESLDLSGVVVGPGFIASSLSKIPKLKYLRIKKYRKLTSEVVRQYLGHLNEVAIQDCTDSNGDECRLSKKDRILMGEIEMPLVKLFCDCGECDNRLCCCQDCHQYT